MLIDTTSTSYDSVVTLALPFVTLTPSSRARATMSTRFRAETACEILEKSAPNHASGGILRRTRSNVLSGVSAVVHEEEVEVAGVADEESLVARGHHVAGLLVGAIADLDGRECVS